VTALIAWPTSIVEMHERSIIRWQHRLKRERPTCTERTKSLTRVRMEGWRQWLTRPEKKLVQQKNNRIHLTPTGFLMEGVYTH
jgi:hypothetical protein